LPCPVLYKNALDYLKKERTMQIYESGFNSNCQKFNTVVEKPPVQTNLDIPSGFTKNLWNRISISTKKYLIDNNFVIPKELSGNYRYYNVDNCRIVIDFDSIIGHSCNSGIRFGQNLETKEFLAFKCIGSSVNNPEVVGLGKLNRLKGIIFDEDRVWMAMELINGVSLDKYDWKEHVNNLDSAIKLAISYLDEVEFVAKSGVNQSDQTLGNIMVDLKKEKVFLIDFGGHGTFNYKTLQFVPDALLPYISIMDLDTIMTLLPHPSYLKKNTLMEKYENFYSSLVERRRSGERNKRNSYYFKFTIGDLRKELSTLLN
jgi:serine/threonine protein kinase